MSDEQPSDTPLTDTISAQAEAIMKQIQELVQLGMDARELALEKLQELQNYVVKWATDTLSSMTQSEGEKTELMNLATIAPPGGLDGSLITSVTKIIDFIKNIADKLGLGLTDILNAKEILEAKQGEIMLAIASAIAELSKDDEGEEPPTEG